MMTLIESYAQACPDGKIVLMGYSQGAQVVADTLLGSSTGFGGTVAPPSFLFLSQAKRTPVIVVIQMGDSSHRLNLSFDVGTSVKSGMFPRSNSASYTSDGYAGLIQYYCDTGDEFCDPGNNLRVHLGYMQKHGTQAASFVAGKYKA
ncbi:alpha/beta-hydrolase [Acephala macrosclerotiorum]|nr:alpha/beta-hydrolase [Acephala macrosclerotiorum]